MLALAQAGLPLGLLLSDKIDRVYGFRQVVR